MMYELRWFVLFSGLLWCWAPCHGFVIVRNTAAPRSSFDAGVESNTATAATAPLSLHMSAQPQQQQQQQPSTSSQAVGDSRRKVLLSRTGPYFRLDRLENVIEFGATADLVTQLDTESTKNEQAIIEFLQDERGLALSIWDEKLLEERGGDIYRLQVMKLNFVTLQLAPWVDIRMQTLTVQSVNDPTKTFPLFRMQSVDFEPNVQLLPGLRVTAESLGIIIHVVGELRPTADGLGVTGKIAFATTGKLPPPLLLLPDGALKAASNAINQRIVNFAIQSFQQGARAKYKEFRAKQKDTTTTNE